MADRQRLRPILFDCPLTGQKVQGLVAEEIPTSAGTPYESVTCLACSGVHLIDPVHGTVLGARRNRKK